MSGHSKWATIKRKKGMLDEMRGKVFQKLAKEIYVAAKSGDKNIENNASLRMVVEKAKAENMPKDRIQNAIDKASGANNGEVFEAIRYEGYAPSGVAIMVDCLTDNRNRTAMLVRSTLTKNGGNLGTDGSVSYMFEFLGVLEVPKKYDEDTVMGVAIDCDAKDFVVSNDEYTIYTLPNNFISTKDALINSGITEFITSEVTYVAKNLITLSDDACEKVLSLVEALEDIDDVNQVYTNLG